MFIDPESLEVEFKRLRVRRFVTNAILLIMVAVAVYSHYQPLYWIAGIVLLMDILLTIDGGIHAILEALAKCQSLIEANRSYAAAIHEKLAGNGK